MAASRSGKQPPRSADARTTKQRQVNFRLPTETWERLNVITKVRNQTQSHIVIDAINALYNALSTSERRLADQLLEHHRKPSSSG